MQIDVEDSRLTTREKRLLRQIATRLEANPYFRNLREPIPEGYQRELDRVFGDCGEDGDLSERGCG